MIIEEELTDYLKKNIRNTSFKDRNIEIIEYYYGFRNGSYPTFENVAVAFQLNSRQRVAQILNKNFRNKINVQDLKSVIQCSNLLEKEDYIFVSRYESLLKEKGVVQEDINIRGLLSLIHDVGLCKDYDLYAPDLERVSQSHFNKYEDFLLIRQKSLSNIKKLVRKIKLFPANLGIAKIEYIVKETSAKRDLIYRLIINLPDS